MFEMFLHYLDEKNKAKCRKDKSCYHSYYNNSVGNREVTII